jgi:hypothetical protein
MPDTERLSQHRPFIHFWFTRVTTIIGYQMLTVTWLVGGIGTMRTVLLGLRLFPQLARIDRLESMRHV